MGEQKQKAAIIRTLEKEGPCTVTKVSRLTGFNPYLVRSHLEEARNAGELDYHWIRGWYSIKKD